MKMQRIAAFALAAIVACTLMAETAGAQGQRIKVMPLTWRTSYLEGTTAVVKDTASFCNAAGTQLTYDTTSAIPTAGWELPNGIVWGGTVDTLQYFNLHINGMTAGGNAASAFDSLLVQTQVSTDGVTWVTATPNRTFDATRTTGNANMAIIAGTGTNASIVVPFWQRELLGKLVPGFITATDILLWGWPLMRFIVNTSGGDGCYTGEIHYLSSL